MAKEIDAKFLKGLTFRGSKAQKVKAEEGGKEKTVFVPFERPLEPGDVLDWKDKGDSIVLVTSNGRKHTVAKGKGQVSASSLDGNVGQAVDAISKMTDAAQIKAFVKGDDRKGVTDAAEAAIAGLK